MKSWEKNFPLKMLYIKLFRELQKNILPKYGKILRLVKQPGQAGTKKELACPGKLQNTNHKLQTNHNPKITNYK